MNRTLIWSAVDAAVDLGLVHIQDHAVVHVPHQEEAIDIDEDHVRRVVTRFVSYLILQ